MKSILFSLFFVVLGLSGISQESGLIKFDHSQIDLGEVVKGAIIDTVFYFTNVSKEEVQIDIVDGCECTTLDWIMDVIPPGERGYIKVIFDSANKEKEEVIDIDITLLNEDPKTGGPAMDNVTYIYKFVK